MLYSIPKTKMLGAAQDSLSPGSKSRSMFVEIMIFLLVVIISMMPQEFIVTIATMIFMFRDPKYIELITQSMQNGVVDEDAVLEFTESFVNNIPAEIYVVSLAASGFMILGAVIYCRAFEKRRPMSLGFNKRGALPEYLIGIIIGAVMISLPAFFCFLTKCVGFQFNDSAAPLTIVLFFLAFLLQGMGEEALFRGYLLTTLSRRNNIWTSIIMSSLIFAIFHIANANFSIIAFINITLFGIFAAVFMLKRGSIWAVGAIHSVWNFMQGNIFGFSVSGGPQYDSVLNATGEGFGVILSGGEFGLEGGLGATIVLIAAILLALLMPAKRSELAGNVSIDNN